MMMLSRRSEGMEQCLEHDDPYVNENEANSSKDWYQALVMLHISV